MSGYFKHAEMPGVAWYIKRQEVVQTYDPFEDSYDEENTGMVVAVMVGDDAEHIVDPDDLTEIEDDDFCPGCGQMGCGHYR